MVDKDYQKQLEAWDKGTSGTPLPRCRITSRNPPLLLRRKWYFLKDIEGREYIDGVSSMWCNLHGHRKREIDHAIKGQLDKVAHTTLLGMSNVPAIELARKLVEIAPGTRKGLLFRQRLYGK